MFDFFRRKFRSRETKALIENRFHALNASLKETEAADRLMLLLDEVDQALLLYGDIPLFLGLKGGIYSKLGAFSSAIECFQAALQRDPCLVFAIQGLVNVFESERDWVQAELVLRKAIQDCPESADIYGALGRLLLEQGNSAEAFRVLERASVLNPEGRDIAAWFGQACLAQHDHTRAAQQFALADERFPLDPAGLCFWASSLTLAEGEAAADLVLAKGLARYPDDPLLVWAQSLNCLLQGNWSRGFALFESRYKALQAYPDFFFGKHERPAEVVFGLGNRYFPEDKQWCGQRCANHKILLWPEQGLGDSLMMLRFIPVLLSRPEFTGAELRVLLAESVIDLARESFPGVTFLPTRTDWKIQSEWADFHCSLMSLPFVLGVTVDNVPGDVPYFSVPEKLSARWAHKISFAQGMKIGVVWAGFHGMPLDDLRSLPLQKLAPLLDCPGVTFFSLQKDDEARDELRMSQFGLVDYMGECHSLLDTAGLIMNLDLVISVDTALAHLAGALGKPVWLLNRKTSEWRWLLNREDSVWYPTMRIFTQKKLGDWETTVQEVKAALLAQGFQ